MSRSTCSAAHERRVDPDWLPAVAVLGTSGGDGIGVGGYRLPGEPHAARVACGCSLQAVPGVNSVCHPSPPTQLSYRRQRHKEVSTLTTANSTAELTLPEEEEDYIIRIQTLSEGGLGPASEPIRVHRLSKTPSRLSRIQEFNSVNNLCVGKKKKKENRRQPAEMLRSPDSSLFL